MTITANSALIGLGIYLVGMLLCIIWNGNKTNSRLARSYAHGLCESGWVILLAMYFLYPVTQFMLVRQDRYLAAKAIEALAVEELTAEEYEVFAKVFGNVTYMTRSEVQRYSTMIRKAKSLPTETAALIEEVYANGPIALPTSKDRMGIELLIAMGYVTRTYCQGSPGYVGLTPDGGYALNILRQLNK